MKTINLKKILKSELSSNYPAFELEIGDNVSFERALLAMKEACRQVLELAAENADTSDVLANCFNEPCVDKQSILDTINQIK